MHLLLYGDTDDLNTLSTQDAKSSRQTKQNDAARALAMSLNHDGKNGDETSTWNARWNGRDDDETDSHRGRDCRKGNA